MGELTLRQQLESVLGCRKSKSEKLDMLEHMIKLELSEHTVLAIKNAVTSTIGMMPLLDEGGIRKMKADGVREAIEATESMCKFDDELYCDPEDLNEYANKLERGRL